MGTFDTTTSPIISKNSYFSIATVAVNVLLRLKQNISCDYLQLLYV